MYSIFIQTTQVQNLVIKYLKNIFAKSIWQSSTNIPLLYLKSFNSLNLRKLEF